MNINTGMTSSYQVQRPPPPTGQGVVDKFDTDKSGGLSATEIEDTRVGQMIGDRFDEVDIDGDGVLSVSELDTDIQANAPPEGGRPPPLPGEGGGGQSIPGQSSTFDMDTLFTSLFSNIENEVDTEQLTASAQTLYTQMQSLLSDTATA